MLIEGYDRSGWLEDVEEQALEAMWAIYILGRVDYRD
jgi:hypothetical protein